MTGKILYHCHSAGTGCLPKEAVDAPFLLPFQASLDRTLSSLV